MILGIGIDSIEIARFSQWHTYSRTTLERIFSSYEIDYCLSVSTKSAERFAARFAAREAFYKALCHSEPLLHLPFLTVCRKICIKESTASFPQLVIDWHDLLKDKKEIQHTHGSIHLSITHNQTTALALIIIEGKKESCIL